MPRAHEAAVLAFPTPRGGALRRFGAWAWKEFRRILPAYIFFFVAFNFLNETQWLMVGDVGTHFELALILIASGIVAKVLVLADHLPFIDLFPNKPLIWNTLWKTFVYSATVLVVRYLEHLVRFTIHARSLAVGYQRYMAETPWNVFWAIQLWYVALFLVFVSARDTVHAVGTERVRRVFFGR